MRHQFEMTETFGDQYPSSAAIKNRAVQFLKKRWNPKVSVAYIKTNFYNFRTR